MTDISPLDLLHRALRFWWVVAACAVLGGLVGLIYASAHPPIYEASAIYRAAFDQARAPDTDFRAIEAAKQAALDIIMSAEVRAQVLEEAAAQGVTFDPGDFDSGRFTVQRMDDRWLLAVRSEDARDAAALANMWAAAALPPLEEAYAHALTVEQLDQRIAFLMQCFAAADLASANACAGTNLADRGEFATVLAELSSRLSTEEQGARGIVAALTLSSGREASPPAKPIYAGRNTLTLIGMFLGFLVGAGVTVILPSPLKGKNEPA